jgi:hypothetical protein
MAGKRIARRLIATVTLLVSLLPAVAARPASAYPAFVEFTVGELGPLGPIVVVGDSVMLGTVLPGGSFEPSLPMLLMTQGWGPVFVKAGAGFSSGLMIDANNGANAASWVRRNRAETGGASAYVVVLGNNDTGHCGSDVACSQASIRHMLSAIGPGADVWWSKITMPQVRQQASWNGALDSVSAAEGNLHVWDWPAIQTSLRIPLTDDGVHLQTPEAYRKRSGLMADDIATWLGRLRSVEGSALEPLAALESSTPPTGFRSRVASRVLDTRSDPSGRGRTGRPLAVDLSAVVPAGSTAVSINLTVDDPADDGFLTAYACGSPRPSTSNLNYRAHQARGSHAIVALRADRRVCVDTSSDADVIVDVQGAFVTGGDLLVPQAPARVADTRSTGRATTIEVPIDPAARAVAANLTATGAAKGGFLTAYACGTGVPTVSNVNFDAGETIAGAAYIATGPNHRICVTASAPVDVIIDITGTFGPSGTLRFTPALPNRRLDTRTGIGGIRGPTAPGDELEVSAVPANARAVTGTITLLASGSNAFLTAFPCGSPLPLTSSVNAPSGAVIANSVTVGTTAGNLCIASSAGARVLFDTTGWWS